MMVCSENGTYYYSSVTNWDNYFSTFFSIVHFTRYTKTKIGQRDGDFSICDFVNFSISLLSVQFHQAEIDLT